MVILVVLVVVAAIAINVDAVAVVVVAGDWGGESSSEVPQSGTGDQQVCVCVWVREGMCGKAFFCSWDVGEK